MPPSRWARGLVKGWRGKVAFQALRGAAAGRQRIAAGERGRQERRPVADVRCHQGQDRRRRGHRHVDARPGANGIALNASIQLSGVDGTALRYRNLAMPAGRASMQVTLASQGRSASALTGALSGSGTVTLESGKDRRARSARLRGGGARQRRRSGQGRCEAEADRRTRAAGRRAGGRRRRKSRSPSATAGFASAPPRSMPMACAPPSPAAMIFRPTRPISAPRWR